ARFFDFALGHEVPEGSMFAFVRSMVAAFDRQALKRQPALGDLLAKDAVNVIEIRRPLLRGVGAAPSCAMSEPKTVSQPPSRNQPRHCCSSWSSVIGIR